MRTDTRGRRTSATWKSIALSRVEELRGELAVAETGELALAEAERRVRSPQVGVAAEQIKLRLREAETYASRGFWRSLANWLTGADIERVWAAIHAADELMFLVLTPASARAKIPELQANVERRLDEKDPRRSRYRAVLMTAAGLTQEQAIRSAGAAEAQDETVGSTGAGETLELRREDLVEIRRSVNRISDDAHGDVRSFRNVVLGFIVVLSAGLIAVAFDAPSDPWLPVCGPSGSCTAIWQIEVVGALGGLLAGVLALRRLEGFRGPYGLPITMALLKIPTGALTGLLGAIWMQNQILGGLSPQDGSKLLAYVAFFGFAQELFTNFADGQAAKVLGQARA
jgi:hypothetical protein